MFGVLGAWIAAASGALVHAQGFVPQEAQAGLSVAPVMLNLSGSAMTTSTIVSNPGSAPITVQARIFSWASEGEEDVYTPTRAVAVSPPLFQLAPGARQAVRIVALTPPANSERSYRLIIDQLPVTDAPGQLQMPVRMILPVFVAPDGQVVRKAELKWDARYDQDRHVVVVQLANKGTVHSRILELGYESPNGVTAIAPGLAGYALPGSVREWSYAAAVAPASLTLVAQADGQRVRATVGVAR